MIDVCLSLRCPLSDGEKQQAILFSCDVAVVLVTFQVQRVACCPAIMRTVIEVSVTQVTKTENVKPLQNLKPRQTPI